MNEVIRQMIHRKSIRAYTGEAVIQEEKELILEAAVQAPTAGNQQLYTILDITDPQLKAALVDSCDHQPMIAQAEWILIFCADCKKWYDGFLAAGAAPREPGVGDLMLAVCDAMIAAQNAVNAAESLGIGSCYIGDIMENCQTQRRLLNLPRYVFPVGMIIFGRPTAQQMERPKPQRVNMEYIVHKERYHALSPEQLEAMWSGRTGLRSYADWMQAFCNRKYNSDFSKEMSRSVAEYLKDFANSAE